MGEESETVESFRYSFANCSLCEASGELTVGGVPTPLQPRERQLLFLLVRRPGEYVAPRELLETIWGGHRVDSKVLGNLVWEIRRTLGDAEHTLIRSERNRGYCLAVPVSRAVMASPGIETLAPGRPLPGRPTVMLVECIGMGGQAEVWLGESGDGRRTVFKFAKTREHEAALRREVTISRILEGSLSSDQLAHFVPILEWDLEIRPSYIELPLAGQSLRAWSKGPSGLAARPLAERLEILARIADGVAAAHSVGVLHEDLKPDNVLVDEHDGRLDIRIGDFGAGRLLTEERARLLDITVRGWTIANRADSQYGTLLWMAPELFEGAPPTLQSDVYSLGVMLYQIAVGDMSRVLAPNWQPDVDDELLREDIEAATRRDAALRLGDAHELARHLRALEQRRSERMCLRDEQARAARAEELLARSRARRPYLAVAAVALLAGLCTSTWFYFQQVQKTKAARALSDFVDEDLLQAAIPNFGGSPTITLKDAMIKSIPLAHRRFEKEPELEVDVLGVFDNTFSTLGEYKAMEDVARREAQLDMQLHGVGSIQALSDRLMLANALLLEGKIADSKHELDGVRPLAEAKGQDPVIFPLLMQVETQFAFQRSDFSSAYAYTGHLIDFYRQTGKGVQQDDDELNAASLSAIQLLLYAGRPKEAEDLVAQILPDLDRAGATAAPLRLLVQAAKYTAYRDQGKFDAAAKGFNAVCPALGDEYGADNEQTATCRRAQAFLDEDIGHWSEAAQLLQGVDATYRKVDGCSGTSMCIYSESDCAFALSRAGDVDAALPLAEHALDEADRSTTPDLTTLPHALYILGNIELAAGKIDEARAALTRLGEADKAGLPATADGDWRGRAELLDAAILQKLGRGDDARAKAQNALALFRQIPARSIVEINDTEELLRRLS